MSESDSKPQSRTIAVDYLARVEGEGALHLVAEGGRVTRAELRIFEPPRFFEGFLRGRDFREAPDITARICGICPVAYQTSACQAMEQIVGVEVDGALRLLRRLLYCGEWIESHGLHIFMLHLPDFLGYPDAITLGRDRPELVKMGLRIKKAGNSLMTALAGREIHPINVRVGGFYRAPHRHELTALREEFEYCLTAMEGIIDELASLRFPDFERDYRFMALTHPDEYPIDRGELARSDGARAGVEAYDEWLIEHHEERSTSLHSYCAADGTAVCLGPLARYALNHERLTPRAAAAATRAGLDAVCRNPFKSILVRSVELIFAFEEALRLLAAYERPTAACVPFTARAGTGYGASEAPRGICYHRYSIDGHGVITDSKIVAPTSVNQRVIEEDLRAFAEPNLHLPDEPLRDYLEQAIRNYDPCISCSTHFLDLTVERR
ncbi:Ni/Fe hydrogenase subunit alpha [Halorhodospira abdelmalekii]|uniref:Ni/Fe hydrogenase subunit alpha n=1 Tax=Halorhodospira abdelmalekii TaxID=421629 RepID=UPI0019059E62|nr:nickel-dependent hydrogenase large subunit [Halorhodospira abdelmalekii]MBK1735994.1 Ni/Fe hydrogenase subunit alpha [Halorhodospira abdelmalekii]